MLRMPAVHLLYQLTLAAVFDCFLAFIVVHLTP